MLQFSYHSTFNALGNSKTPLYLLVFSSLLNIGMDLLLVKGFGMGIAGAAVATVFAQGLSALISFFILMHDLKKFDVEGLLRLCLFDLQMLGGMIKVAIPSMLQLWLICSGRLYRRNAHRIHLCSAYDCIR